MRSCSAAASACGRWRRPARPAPVHFLVFGFITGLTHGYSILISQKFGAGSAAGVRRAVANSAYIAVLSSAVITVLSLVFSRG